MAVIAVQELKPVCSVQHFRTVCS